VQGGRVKVEGNVGGLGYGQKGWQGSKKKDGRCPPSTGVHSVKNAGSHWGGVTSLFQRGPLIGKDWSRRNKKKGKVKQRHEVCCLTYFEGEYQTQEWVCSRYSRTQDGMENSQNIREGGEERRGSGSQRIGNLEKKGTSESPASRALSLHVTTTMPEMM